MSRSSLFSMTATAMLGAIILVLVLTGLGYIPIGPLTLTILTLPVAIGAVVLGPVQGLILGLVFGLTSFATCFSTDAFGMFILGINPFYTFVACVVTRVLCGGATGLLYRKWQKYRWAPGVCCLATALINTVRFLGSLWLFFGGAIAQNYGFASIWAFFAAFAGVNALIEAAANLVIGGAVTAALLAFRRKMRI